MNQKCSDFLSPVQGRHIEQGGVLNHQPKDCLRNCLFKAQIKENTKAPRPWPFVRGIHRGPVNFPHKGPVTRKKFPFDDVIMSVIWSLIARGLYPCPQTHSIYSETKLLQQGFYLLSGYTLCNKISWNLDAVRYGVRVIRLRWKCTGVWLEFAS